MVAAPNVASRENSRIISEAGATVARGDGREQARARAEEPGEKMVVMKVGEERRWWQHPTLRVGATAARGAGRQ